MLNLKHGYSIISMLIFIIFKIMPSTGNLRQSYKWINFTQFLDRKNSGIKIVVAQKLCNLRVTSLIVLALFRKWRVLTMVMKLLI